MIISLTAEHGRCLNQNACASPVIMFQASEGTSIAAFLVKFKVYAQGQSAKLATREVCATSELS